MVSLVTHFKNYPHDQRLCDTASEGQFQHKARLAKV